jgi:hypothetical protein
LRSLFLCRATDGWLLPPSTVLTPPPELLSQSSCVTFPLSYCLGFLFPSLAAGSAWLSFQYFTRRVLVPICGFFFSLGFLGSIVERFFLFCFAAQEDFVFVLWLLLLLLLQGHDGCLVGSVGVFWKLKVHGR